MAPHLTLDERRVLAQLLHRKISVTQIALQLGRHRATVHREIRRNTWRDFEVPMASGYWHLTAQQLAEARRARQRKLVRHSELRAVVIERLKDGWSPEQIAGRLARDGGRPRVCHETIYRYVYSQDGRAQELAQHLPERRRFRKPRFARKPRGLVFPERCMIRHRPQAVKDRQEFGHWEADLMIFRKEHGPANVATVVERVSRYTVLFRNNDRRSRPIMNGLITLLAPLPQPARRSLTFDRGLEFVSWRELEQGLGVQAWFCDPQAPWQKPTVENTNRRVRRWLPRETVLLELSPPDLTALSIRMNATPRKCLGFRTPTEVFRDNLRHLRPAASMAGPGCDG
ncbi:IS30 family transposase [Cereibacter sphaeroides]|uniref:IS30 family transposase n=1 Tax=Cereibacter sphaeroides TaxID=1063 RepID=UPI001F44898C|nr:IS30 family transposase [Cereibacter sphaeroides]MCE6949654.1 IS30 family transposase [Cereibacter sphaeroides]